MQYTLEVCVDSIESALAAAHAGANRLELATCLEIGGVTPSYSLISHTCRRINSNCKIHVLVRPRGGDFVYSHDEVDLITADIIQIAGLGAHGVVAGFLQPNGTIDSHLTRKIVELCTALNLDFTFHRAFDVVKDQQIAVNTLIDCGVRRVLTSGGHPKAFHGLEQLASLIKQSEGKISIMPGGGVDEENAATILQVTSATEIHGSFGETVTSSMQFLHPKVHFSSKIASAKARNMSERGKDRRRRIAGDDEEENQENSSIGGIEYSKEDLAELWGRRVASEEKIRKVRAALNDLSAAEEEQQMD